MQILKFIMKRNKQKTSLDKRHKEQICIFDDNECKLKKKEEEALFFYRQCTGLLAMIDVFIKVRILTISM